jgi:PadR family transcriptional regulator, regulatory protein PadR
MSMNRHIFTAPKQEEIFVAELEEKSEIEIGMLQMQILWILKKQPSHGYELMKTLSDLKKTTIKQGTLYPTLQKLEKLKLIKRREEDRRIFYDITEKGKKTLDRACTDFTRTFFGIFHDFVCQKCVSRDLVNIKR